jgi:hypothetical protein
MQVENGICVFSDHPCRFLSGVCCTLYEKSWLWYVASGPAFDRLPVLVLTLPPPPICLSHSLSLSLSPSRSLSLSLCLCLSVCVCGCVCVCVCVCVCQCCVGVGVSVGVCERACVCAYVGCVPPHVYTRERDRGALMGTCCSSSSSSLGDTRPTSFP